MTLALLGLLWVSIAARPARAMGCHAPERPALGFAFAWEVPPAPVPTSALTEWRASIDQE